MKNAFIHQFYDACCDSCDEAVFREGETDPAFKKAKERYSAFFARLLEQLQGESRDWLFSLDEAAGEINALQDIWIYQQAYRDCLYLLRWMGLFPKE